MIKQVLAAVVTAASASALHAQTPPAAQSSTEATSPARAPATRSGVLQSIDRNFKRLDGDSDGALSKAEIDTARQAARERAAAAVGQRLEQQFGRLDTNKDGQLSLAEFKAAAPAPKADPDGTEEALDRLDANNDGRVTEAEFSGPVLARFDSLDANKDGTLSAEERRARTAPEGR